MNKTTRRLSNGLLQAVVGSVLRRNMLPGTISAADRYVRASHALQSSPKFKDKREAPASILAQMRAVSPPLGMSDPEEPNISSTLYRIVADSASRRYYFDDVLDPSVLDHAEVDLSSGAKTMRHGVMGPTDLVGTSPPDSCRPRPHVSETLGSSFGSNHRYLEETRAIWISVDSKAAAMA